jgi:hypothetical protein
MLFENTRDQDYYMTFELAESDYPDGSLHWHSTSQFHVRIL